MPKTAALTAAFSAVTLRADTIKSWPLANLVARHDGSVCLPPAGLPPLSLSVSWPAGGQQGGRLSTR